MEKQFRTVHGQQFFFVSTVILFYFDVMALVVSLIAAYPNQEKFLEMLGFLSILSPILIGIFAIIAIIVFAVSRIWVEPYATLADNHLMVNGQRIYYLDIQKIELIPGTWSGTGRHSIPYGPAEIRLYCKDKRYTRFSEESYITLEGISYRFFFALKEKCPSASVHYKYLLAIFLIIPICVAAVSTLIALIPDEYL